MKNVSIERITTVNDEVVEAAVRLSSLLESSNQVTLSEAYLESIVRNQDHFWLMAKDETKYIGMASLFIMRMPTNVRSFLENVVVDTDYRGQGVGSALCKAAFTIADSEGVNTLRAQAGTSNAASRAMLENAGFRIENYLDYYEMDVHDGPRF